ncbi:MAG: ATP-binding protein [Chitinophagales bacterium]
MKIFNVKTNIIFILVICYIFAAFIWWAFLLKQKTESEYHLKIENERLQYNHEHDLPWEDQSFLQTEAHETLLQERSRQRWMILGEGAVFLILLVAGALKIKSSFQKELALARQKNNFLLSITHELKSPLASIRLSLETLLKRLSAEEKFKQIMRNSLQDVDRLSDLVDNILLAARMENNSYPFQWESLNISELAEDALNMVAERFENKRIFQTNIEADIFNIADRMALNAVLVNLLENAVKYSPEGSAVELNVREKDKMVILEVADRGGGIPDAEKAQVFKKFYRLGNEETRNTKGTGLGLYIVNNIVAQMKGSIEVKDNPGGGTLFRLSFQKKN